MRRTSGCGGVRRYRRHSSVYKTTRGWLSADRASSVLAWLSGVMAAGSLKKRLCAGAGAGGVGECWWVPVTQPGWRKREEGWEFGVILDSQWRLQEDGGERGLRGGYRSGEQRSGRRRTQEMRSLCTLGTIYVSELFLCVQNPLFCKILCHSPLLLALLLTRREFTNDPYRYSRHKQIFNVLRLQSTGTLNCPPERRDHKLIYLYPPIVMLLDNILYSFFFFQKMLPPKII